VNFLNGALEVLRAAQNSRDEKAKTPSLQRLQSKKVLVSSLSCKARKD
jgi:hypothetical protein